MDRLDYIFESQKKLQKGLLDVELPADRPDLIAFYSLGLMSEIGELLQSDKRWKHIIKSGGDTTSSDLYAAKLELMDCALYIFNMALAMDITADDFMYYYDVTKRKVCKRNNLEVEWFSNWQLQFIEGYSECEESENEN